MTAQYDPDQVAELLALDEKRTQGDTWEWKGDFPEGNCPHDSEWTDHGPDLVVGKETIISSFGHDASGLGISDDDALFIAAAPKLAAQLRAASVEIERVRAANIDGANWVAAAADEINDLKHDIERHVQICADQAERISQLEHELKLEMSACAKLEHAIEQAAQIAEQQVFYPDTPLPGVARQQWVKEQIAANIRALAGET